jgi:L-lysine 2,3-aminomutase
MATHVLKRYIDPLLSPELEHVQSIRIGTKALGYWPQRFVTDPDADQLLRLFERVVSSGRHLALMAHYNHPVELKTDIAKEAVRRVRATGAEIRMQSPVVKHVNDRPELWSELWERGVRLGMVPYYFFVERDTGPRQYFELPLFETYEIFRRAYVKVSGLARTVRGPSMSATPGKVRILGVTTIGNREVFVLDYLQARNPDLVRRPFFAAFDPDATWFDQLRPAFESDRLFFERDSTVAEPELPRYEVAQLANGTGIGTATDPFGAS